MTRLLKSSFLWQFTGGFVLGAIGLFALQPAMQQQQQQPAPTEMAAR